MKIPETLVSVIKKLNPEIEEVIPLNFSSMNRYNPNNFEPQQSFMVHVRLKLVRGCSPKGTNEEYTEKLNTAFLYVHPDIKFIKMFVDGVSSSPELSRFDIFQELFDVQRDDLRLDQSIKTQK